VLYYRKQNDHMTPLRQEAMELMSRREVSFLSLDKPLKHIAIGSYHCFVSIRITVLHGKVSIPITVLHTEKSPYQ